MKILVFFSADIYPKGGMKDLIGECQTENEALELIKMSLQKNDDPLGLISWWQIVNRESLQIIRTSED